MASICWNDGCGRRGAVLLLAVASVAVAAPLLAPYDPRTQDRSAFYQGPSFGAEGCDWTWEAWHRSGPGDRPDVCRPHILGTDALGRDVLSRILYGTRTSVGTAALGVTFTVILGSLVGTLSGFLGGWWDRILMRLTELVMALPGLYLVLAVRHLFPDHLSLAQSSVILVGCLTAVGWCGVARLVRGRALTLREQDFIWSATAAGASRARLLFRHILPNLTPFILLQAGLTLPYFLLGEATLSFLGLGVPEPEPSWGNMLAAAAGDYTVMTTYWWVLLAPAGALTLAVLVANLWIEGLRRAYFSGLPGAGESSGSV